MTQARLELGRDHVMIVIDQGDGTEAAYRVGADRSAAYRMIREAATAANATALALQGDRQGAPQTIADDDPTPVVVVDDHERRSHGQPDTLIEAMIETVRDTHEYVKATPEVERKVSRGFSFLRSASKKR